MKCLLFTCLHFKMLPTCCGNPAFQSLSLPRNGDPFSSTYQLPPPGNILPMLWVIKGSGARAKRQPGAHCHGTSPGKCNRTLSGVTSCCCHFHLTGNQCRCREVLRVRLQQQGRQGLLSHCQHSQLPTPLRGRSRFSQRPSESSISSGTHW